MDYNVFTDGIEPGGLRNKEDIGILICFMLDNIKKPFLKDDLVEIIQENALANYFETISAISELIEAGNIEYTGDKNDCLKITQNGKLVSRQLNTNLSLSVRQKAVRSIMSLMERRRVENENPVTIQKADGGGYNVTFRITDGMRDLMSLTLFVPDITEANAVKRTFHKNPQRLYSIVLAGVIGEPDMIADALKGLK